MTAEIAIINRVAVTLAADSAMTVTGGGDPKVYNSIDKIFELSSIDPIGVMIYNSLDFMGIPIDVIVREFRNSNKCVPFKTVKACADAFFDFLHGEVGAPVAAQESFVEHAAATLTGIITKEFEEQLEKIVVANPATPPKGFDPGKMMSDIIESYLRPLRKRKPSSCFVHIKPDDIKKRYSDAIDRGISSMVPSRAPHFNLLRDLTATFLHRNVISPSFTGIVVAGFGVDDRFPEVHSFEIDGLVHDGLRMRTDTPTQIDRISRFAEILPFAQRDMADSFLFGVAPEIEKGIPEFLETIIRATGASIIKEVAAGNSSQSRTLTAKLERSIKRAITEFSQTAMRREKERYRQEILQMVRFMPKQELADFAESMINITSHKRHVSSQQETVAGPIDVAVISKSEGFIWVKRKHYFDPAFNPRYFMRKFGTVPPVGGSTS